MDFVNTLDWRLRRRPIELFRHFPDLLRWGRSAGVLGPAQARRLRQWAAKQPRAARAALTEAAAVREAIAATFQSLVEQRTPSAHALRRLEDACREATAARALRARDGAAAWVWRDSAPEPRRAMWAAALDAARILTSPDHERIRQCADEECGWFFLDTSRNRSRRWCSMEACGNRNKARRFYRRSAAKKGTP